MHNVIALWHHFFLNFCCASCGISSYKWNSVCVCTFIELRENQEFRFFEKIWNYNERNTKQQLESEVFSTTLFKQMLWMKQTAENPFKILWDVFLRSSTNYTNLVYLLELWIWNLQWDCRQGGTVIKLSTI